MGNLCQKIKPIVALGKPLFPTQTMKKLLTLAEQGFTIVSLVLYSGGPLSVILSGGYSEGEQAAAPADFALIQLLFLLNYLITFVLLVLRWKKVVYIFRKDRFIGLLVGIAVFSIFWSFIPSMTKTRSIALVGTSLFGLYLASRYTLREQLKLLGWMFGLVLVLSLLFAVALPKYGIMGGTHAGAWRGIYVHKNVFGKVMVLSTIILLLLALDVKKQRWLLWLGVGLSFGLLVMARSTTSLLNLVMLLTVIPIYQTLRWRYILMLPAVLTLLTVSGSVSLWVTTNLDSLLGALGKDATLTGRTEMWPYIVEMIEKQPWLGYGYSGFWQMQNWNSPAAYVWRASGWMAPNAHNGFLDIWLQLGLLGFSIFLLGFLTTLLRGLNWVRLLRGSEGLWPVLYLTYTLLTNLTETSLMIQNDVFWVFYVAVAFSVLMPPELETKSVNRKTGLGDSSINQSLYGGLSNT